MADFDVVVIGSGFGGAITGCRLAEAGYRVVILERGRRWKVEDYPRKPGDAWVWDQSRPARRNGWLDLRIFPNMAVILGTGVGGGSLIYANISIEAKPDLFQQGWPPEITYQELKPRYEKVDQMMKIEKVPESQWSQRTKLVKEAAQKAGYGDRFLPLDLAVRFDPQWSYDLPDPHDVKHSRPFINPQGQEQGTCVHLGNCDIGCDVKAKNTLDLNYIPQAEKSGAEVRSLHIARYVAPESNGYRVRYDRIVEGRLQGGNVTGRIVVVAAGSLGSTELLLRCRDQFKTLPRLSDFLGRNWSSNGDFLTPAFYKDRKIFPSRGPTISAAIDFLGERNEEGTHFLIEDGGFPDLLRNWMEEKAKESGGGRREKTLSKEIRFILRRNRALDSLMPWFGMGRDGADGRLSLRRSWWLFGKRLLHLDWDIDKSEETIQTIVKMHEKLTDTTGGNALVPLTWTLSKDLITPHPLGGCNMGTTAENGVVNHKGEVFDHRNLYVADGAIIPEAIGANPSKTIAALAERIAELIVEEGR